MEETTSGTGMVGLLAANERRRRCLDVAGGTSWVADLICALGTPFAKMRANEAIAICLGCKISVSAGC